MSQSHKKSTQNLPNKAKQRTKDYLARGYGVI